MKWVLGIVLGLIVAGVVMNLLLSRSRVARRVRKLSRFASDRYPAKFWDPVRQREVVDVLQRADDLSKRNGWQFDLACLYVLSVAANPNPEVLSEVLREWDEAWARGADQW
jgi:hypothetical protein